KQDTYLDPPNDQLKNVTLRLAGCILHGRVLLSGLFTEAIQQPPAPARSLLSQRVLERRVIINHPLPPERRHCVRVQHYAIPSAMSLRWTRWGGIEAYPAIARKIRFHPGMRGAGANHVLSRQVINP